jgi:CRP-like cAMP-binding protein
VRLTSQDLLVPQGDPIDYVYFPERGMISLVVLMEDGRGVEAASVGFEGMAGAALALGEERSVYEITVQVEGEALRIPADGFRRLLNEDAALRDVALRYVQVQLLQASRAAACNRLHEVEERMARWLLQTHDWVWNDRFYLTQEFLAQMLGVRRATVTVAAGTLQRAGLIAYRRGEVTILDRPGLEDVACEDYGAVREAIDRLLPLKEPSAIPA